ncbi:MULTISPECIES: type I-E CRISPR-associated protein Cas6/Cse3/CasE [Streptomyces]|uniref:Type I-E CRISPR-associated protein Cas6/Cse3/CasE n=1 Tax=Streptomyces doudnae TaxID=3075536 RepID=A0ABD5EIR5_9ACTN|nr:MULTISPECIES: type I-E CRISPR-associated protein Cas6/Cse3/CasE [unclassified Streptomyces]MDT0433312.1 type I-E CRISPR-associated protein Cas6/Cse3/CasE [Streptomyces sp. DSM 41981]MYQ68082.1 type I-E CRISPR-associated protein Cas6/Cse3/CasE [Streptomyces sp. SID4950]SCE42881.1 CRISPR system Cascade subunit CasE [Streptomyces sp. SolWspMP-5a-2]
MYLTRFRINTARPEARRLLGSPHRMHGAVNMAFPEPPARDGNGPRVLWRVDPAPADRIDLFITSPHRPDLTHLVEQAGWPHLPEPGWRTFAYEEFLNALAEDDVWAFRLTANPVHHIRKDTATPDSPTKRTAHVTARHQIGWLLQHQQRAGFAIIPRIPSAEEAPAQPADYQVVVHNRAAVRFGRPAPSNTAPLQSQKRPKAARGPDVHFAQATFDGCLRITDLPSFRRTLTQGLGKAKAYGCGLMTLSPVR